MRINRGGGSPSFHAGGGSVIDSWTGLTAQLILNGIRFRYLRATGKTPKPRAVSLEVTQRCIAKCRMCNIWRVPADTPSLGAEDWLALLSQPLFSDIVELDITGGEPFLRTDLADLIIAICGLKKQHLKSLRSIAITTNGFLTRQVLDQCRRMLAEARHVGVDLIMACAMDGVGDIHDTIRRYPGGWRKLDQTVRGLNRLRGDYENLIIGLKTTVLPINVGQLDDITRYANNHHLFTIISPCIVTKGRYLNADQAEYLTFSPEEMGQMERFFTKKASRWSFHQDRLSTYLQTGRMKKSCSSGFNYFFIRSQGDLMLCPLIDATLGKVTDTDIETLLSSKEAIRIRRRIGSYPECRHCTEPGLERYSLPYEGFTYLSLLPRLGKQRFMEMHTHMGLDKYFL
jgi:MoaA/NifB/PqqE/SkfB family radical SAM enzyme